MTTDNARSGFFEDEQYEKVRAALPEPLANMVAFAFHAGWRIPSEVLRLTWGRVDFTAGVVRLDAGQSKNGEARVFPFDILPELADVLKAHLHRRLRGPEQADDRPSVPSAGEADRGL